MIDDLLTVSKCGIPSIVINAKVNAHIELNNLKFHTKDKNGKSKCHWIHVGGHKKKKDCFIPKVHKEEMLEVGEDTYLGEIIRKD